MFCNLQKKITKIQKSKIKTREKFKEEEEDSDSDNQILSQEMKKVKIYPSIPSPKKKTRFKNNQIFFCLVFFFKTNVIFIVSK